MMNKATESKLILAELGQEVTMTLDEFIDAGGWIEEDKHPRITTCSQYYFGHTVPNIKVVIDHKITEIFLVSRDLLTKDGKVIYRSILLGERFYPHFKNYETIPFIHVKI